MILLLGGVFLKRILSLIFCLCLCLGVFTVSVYSEKNNNNDVKNEEVFIQNGISNAKQEILLETVTNMAGEHYKKLGYKNGEIKSINGNLDSWTVEFENNVSINVIIEVDEASGEILNYVVKLI